MLRQEGYRLIVLTNQSVIARGEACEADVASIHRRLEWELGKEGAYLDGIYLCPHHPHGGFPGERIDLKMKCECRKPATGLFERACAELRIDRARSWMIGDQTRDIEMARRSGVDCSRPDGLCRQRWQVRRRSLFRRLRPCCCRWFHPATGRCCRPVNISRTDRSRVRGFMATLVA